MLCFDMRITGTRQPNVSIVLDVKRIQAYTSQVTRNLRLALSLHVRANFEKLYTVMLRSIFSLENFFVLNLSLVKLDPL